MPTTEQLHVHLAPGEHAVLADAARRQHLSVSTYVRNKLFNSSIPENDEVLLEGLAALKPRFEATQKKVKANILAIEKMRRKSQAGTIYPHLQQFSEDELANIADHLCLSTGHNGLKK